MSREEAQVEDSNAFSFILTFVATVAASFGGSGFYRALPPRFQEKPRSE